MSVRAFPRARAVLPAAVATALAMTLAGCGEEKKNDPPAKAEAAANGFAGKSPDQILADSVAALRGATSFRVAGIMVDEKETIEIDMVTDGTDAQGKLTLPIEGTTVSMEVIKVGERAYFRGRDLWKKAGGAALADRVGDRWVAGSREMRQNFTSFFTPAGWADILKPDNTTITREADSKIGDRPVVTLKDDSSGILFIAATGKPYPLRLAGGDKKGGGEMNFTYDVPVKVSPPPNPLDLTKNPTGV
ncbi:MULTISPECIES: hypothetical protein [Actinomadura]|uniref:Lipoprotein n=1 Tax=Actinomadura yumaensis TaxID=111807 RepID=A0ABW2CCR2_9ACTN|nr:hypothetical protein [Actinomadura sp. J1-007]MWK33519.1 hypothetical protein [Actinomadura sp. J1-007]